MLTEKEKTLIRLLENKNNTPLDIINWIRHHLIKNARRDLIEKVKKLNDGLKQVISLKDFSKKYAELMGKNDSLKYNQGFCNAAKSITDKIDKLLKELEEELKKKCVK